MRLDVALSRLGILAARKTLAPHWEESAAALGGGTPWFLEPAEVEAARVYGGFSPEVGSELQSHARRIASDPALRQVAWHCHRLLYEHPEFDKPQAFPPELGGPFYLLVVMGMVRRVRGAHAAMGVPDAVTRETCLQLSCFARNYAGMSGGELGVALTQLYWTRHYPACRLFRLGRMEYMIRGFRGSLVGYRHRSSGLVVALAEDGTRFTSEGQLAWEPEGGWAATLTQSPDSVTGYAISPEGMAERRKLRLQLSEWERVLGPGDPCLDMHIPHGGAMGPEACADSMRRAAVFFRRFFPQSPFRAVTCASWIFNTQLERIPLSSDNLVIFQHELYLFPVPSNGRDGLWFIFLRDEVDPKTAPRDTSLRRGVADFLATGERWRGGGMFYLLDDLDAYGSEPYRSRWPPAGVEVS